MPAAEKLGTAAGAVRQSRLVHPQVVRARLGGQLRQELAVGARGAAARPGVEDCEIDPTAADSRLPQVSKIDLHRVTPSPLQLQA